MSLIFNDVAPLAHDAKDSYIIQISIWAVWEELIGLHAVKKVISPKRIDFMRASFGVTEENQLFLFATCAPYGIFRKPWHLQSKTELLIYLYFEFEEICSLLLGKVIQVPAVSLAAAYCNSFIYLFATLEAPLFLSMKLTRCFLLLKLFRACGLSQWTAIKIVVIIMATVYSREMNELFLF